MLMVFGLVAASMLSTGQPLKSLIMVFTGILLGLVGIDINSGADRFTFGIPGLFEGLSLVALALGLYGLPEIITTAKGGPEGKVTNDRIRMRDMFPSKAEWKESALPILRGTGIGSFFGALPGTGGTIATFISYSLEKRLSKTPEKFGKGAIAGVASPESANNAAVQTSFIPTMSLGIPGDAVMAMMLGVMMVHGVIPGPQVISQNPDLFWGLVASFVVGNILLVILNVPLVGLWIRLLRVPYHLLYPVMVAFVCVGIYSVSNSVLDIYILMLFGLVGVMLRVLKFDGAALLLGFVLGPMIEEEFRRSMAITGGEFTSFFERPIAAGFGAATLALFAFFAIRFGMKLMRGR